MKELLCFSSIYYALALFCGLVCAGLDDHSWGGLGIGLAILGWAFLDLAFCARENQL